MSQFATNTVLLFINPHPDFNLELMRVTSQNARILIVDDDDEIRNLLYDLLQDRGYRAVGVSNGVDALEKMKGGMRFDLILCDLQMPAMSGLDLLNQMGAAKLEVPFVLMTGMADRKRILHALRKGACHVLQKPFSEDDLLKTLDQILLKDALEAKVA